MAPQNPRDMRDYMRTLERLTVQQRAIPAMIGNAVAVVKEEVEVEKVRHPAAPVELIAQSAFYTDLALRRQRVRFLLDFPDVVFNTDGTAATIQGYQLWGREVLEEAEDTFTDEQPWAIQSTSAESSFRVDGYIPGTQWHFRVRALGTDSIQPGEWSEEILVQMLRDAVPPPQPTTPTIVSARGTLTVKWDGESVLGEMPGDFEYAALAHGTDSSPTTEVARFGREGGIHVAVGFPYYDPQFFRIRAVDESGNLSTWSEQADGYTVPLVDEDIILSELDAAETEIINAGKIILETGVELGQKLKAGDDERAETEKKLTGPGGVTERLADAEGILEDADWVTLESGKELRQRLDDAGTAISNTEKRLTGPGGVTERLTGAETKLGNVGALVMADGVTLDKKLTDSATAISNTEKKLTGPGGVTERLTGAETKLGNVGAIVMADGVTLNKKLTDAGTAIADTEKKLTGPGGLTERLTGAETKLGNVGAIVMADGVTLDKKLTDTATAISTAQGHITTLRDTTVPKLSSDLTSAAGRLTVAEKAITTGATNLTSTNTELGKIAGRITPMEAGLTAVETALPSLQLAINGKTTIYRSTAPPLNDLTKYKFGDRYERWTTLASGGKLLNVWRHDERGWITELLDPTYIPQIDIGAGTFGSLNGGRLQVNSVGAEAIVVGDFTNYALGSDFESPTHPWTINGNTWTVSDIRAHSGTYSLRHPAGNTAVAIAQLNAEIPVDEGDSLYCSFWVWRSTDWNGAGNSRIRFANATENNTNIGGPPFTFAAVPGPAGGAAGWVKVESTFVIPAGVSRLGVDVRTDNTTGQIHIDEIELRRMSTGKLIVNGSITGDHVAAESVAAKIGSFVKINVENITATATANLNSVLAQRIAASTASFQAVDAKNLFVTGTSSLGDAVARRLAAETGSFIQLSVDQLDVTGNTNLKTAVADKLFANIFATNKLTTNQLWVGQGGNLFPYPLNHEGWTKPPLVAFTANGGMTGGPSQTVAATTEQYGSWFGNSEPNRAQYGPQLTPGESYRVSVWVRAAVAIPVNSVRVFMRMYEPGGNTVTNPSSSYLTNDKALAANTWHLIDGIVEIPLRSATIMSIGLYTAGPANFAMTFSDLAIQPAATPSLIVDGGILAKHITASEEMSAKVGQFLTLGVQQLTVTGTANMKDAVADRVFANLFSTRKLMANQVYIGEGGNLFPAALNDPAWGVNAAISFATTGGIDGGPTLAIAASTAQEGTYFAGGAGDHGKRMKLIPGGKYRVRVNVRAGAPIPAGGVAVYLRLSNEGNTNPFTWATPNRVANAKAVPAGTVGVIDGIFTIPDDTPNVHAVLGLYKESMTNVQVRFSDLIFQEAITPELIVDGAITAKHITASEEMSAKVGTFLTLGVEQLTVTGTTNMKDAVADRVFANLFSTRKLMANQVVIGHPGNIMPDPMFLDAEMTQRRNAASTATVSVSSAGDLELRPSATATTYFRPTGANQSVAAYPDWTPVKPGEVWQWSCTVAGMKVAGQIKFIGRSANGQTIASPTEITEVPVGDGMYTVQAKIPSNCYWILPEMVLRPTTGTLPSWIKQGTLSMQQVMTPELIVDGAITAKHITASQEMSAKVGSFLTLDVGQLTATGTSNLNTAVIQNLWTKVVRSQRMTTDMLMVGKGENMIPWFASAATANRTWDPHVPVRAGVVFKTEPTGGRGGGPHGLIQDESIGSTGDVAVFRFASGTTAKDGWVGNWDVEPGQKYIASVWLRAGGAYTLGAPSVRLQAMFYRPDGTNGSLNPAGQPVTGTWTELRSEFVAPADAVSMTLRFVMNRPGHVRIEDPMLVKDGASLIAMGGIVSDHITASESLSSKVGQFLSLDVGKLTATGTSTLNTAVIDNLWAKVVRSRSITADMLLVGKGTNVIPNGDLANGKDGWASQFGISVGDSAALAKGYPATIWLDGEQGNNSPEFPIKGARRYKLSVWARANTAGKRFAIQVIYGSTGAGPSVLNNVVTTTSMTQFEAEFDVPEGVTTANIRLFANQNNGTTTAGRQWFTGFELHEMNAASLIVEGGIVTKQLKVTEDMTVALLKAHKVQAVEIDTNSLAADAVFTGLLDAKLVVSDMFEGKAFEGGTFTGTLFQSDVRASRGVKLDATGLNAWDSTGKKFLTVGNNGVSAVGSFVAEDDTSSITMGSTTATFDRPGLSFEIKGRSGMKPKIFAEAVSGGGASYAVGSLVLVGSEATANSTGRGEVDIAPNGERGKFAVSYGPNSYTGFHWDGEHAAMVGKFNKSSHARSQIRTGTGGAGFVPGGSYQEWTFTHHNPPPNGFVVPITVLPDATPGVGQVLGISVSNITRTGFRARVNCSGANMSAQVTQLIWWAIWTS